jgi:hypothetical protein
MDTELISERRKRILYSLTVMRRKGLENREREKFTIHTSAYYSAF